MSPSSSFPPLQPPSSAQPDPELRRLLEEQRKTGEYLQQLAAQILTYEQHRKQHFDAQSQAFERHMQGLAQGAESLTGNGRLLVDIAVRGIETGAQAAVAAGTRNELQEVRSAVSRVVDQAQQACSAIEQQRGALDAVRRQLLWRLALPLAAGALLCLAGGGLWLWLAIDAADRAQTDAAQARMEAEMVGAFNAADVQLCGERLCVNIEPGSTRHLAGKTYHLAAPREAGR